MKRKSDVDVQSRRVSRVLFAVAVGSVATAVIPQIFQGSSHPGGELGSWVFVAIGLAGTLGALAGKLRYGALAGTLSGFLISVVGSTTHLLMTPAHSGDELRAILAATIIMSILGGALGVLGGLPVKIGRWLRHR